MELKNVLKDLKWNEKLIFLIFQKYTYKIYKSGVQYAFNWNK